MSSNSLDMIKSFTLVTIYERKPKSNISRMILFPGIKDIRIAC